MEEGDCKLWIDTCKSGSLTPNLRFSCVLILQNSNSNRGLSSIDWKLE
jgi:hypothetical protein